ncbi:MAG: hypothetical protein ACI9YT_002740 [Halobacteriales archaeon]
MVLCLASPTPTQMSVRTDADPDKEMTLAFALPAISQFQDPGTVFEDAGTWSRYVGIVDNHSDDVEAYVSEHDLQQDFELGDRDKWLALQDLREATRTDRHVFVGMSDDDRRAAEHTGWEFLTVNDVAEKTGWRLETRGTESDDVEGETPEKRESDQGFRSRLSLDSLWPFGNG